MKKILFLFLLFFNVLIIHAQHADSVSIQHRDSLLRDARKADEFREIIIPNEDDVAIDNSSFEVGEVFQVYEVSPIFNDGESHELMKYLKEKLVYPSYEKEANISGTVLVRFIININGTISNIEILKKVSPGLNKEAWRLIESTNGKWTPGKVNGLPVRVYHNIPIKFSLD